jgi:ubiquinone/menaquinone biosynthesis C-methylase UbiE
MTSHKGFDSLVGIYDVLVRIVFGSAIRRAQICLIKQMPENREWLILGGGTGWILDEIFLVHENAAITYVEASQKMINRAKKRGNSGKVTYILGTIDQLPKEATYDIVMTAFFWDMFQTRTAMHMKDMINQKVKKHAVWLLTDFKNSDIWWQKILLNIMYRFFRMICKIEASKLPDFDQVYLENEHTLSFQSTFYHGMIESTIYKSKK